MASGAARYVQSLHEREYGAEALSGLLFLDRHGAHGLAQVFYRIAKQCGAPL